MGTSHPTILAFVLAIFPIVAAGKAFIALEDDGRGCLTSDCHGSLLHSRFIHPPLLQADCGVCHVPSVQEPGFVPEEGKAHALKTLNPTIENCSQCHTAMVGGEGIDHTLLPGDCAACHDPHGSPSRYLLKARSAGGLCLQCHSEVLESVEYVHGPVALKECLACHSAHGSTHGDLLAREPFQLCVTCHTAYDRPVGESGSIHEPVRDGCTQCHQPHGGAVRGFFPLSQESLCAECHGETLHRIDRSPVSHVAMTEGKDCSACHDPHRSESPKLLTRASMDICLGCHTSSIKTHDGRVLAAVGERIHASAYLHGPIRDGDCTACHEAHGSEHTHLLKGAFPDEFYAPYEDGQYALCFKCHDERIVTREATEATGFRNGRRNLHYEHVNQDKGRSCRACHHEHASHMPFHIRESVDFGRWELMIDFEVTENGGTCLSGCHRPKAYDRISPVLN